MMKILLFGKHGQLGWELHRTLQCLGEVVAFDFPEVDFKAPNTLGPLVKDLKPDVVVNAAAYTDVDKAEAEKDKARLINTEAPGVLAVACRKVGAVLIHYSTDYVFDGRKGVPYVEDDAPNPLNVYGRTKLDGEQAVLAEGVISLIFRTAWVYSLRRENFVTKVLRWARSQKELRIVDDQISNPTWARALAEVTALLLARTNQNVSSWALDRRGLYHIAGRGFASRYELARSIVRDLSDLLEPPSTAIVPALSMDFPSPAKRPLFSALECGRFEQVFDTCLPDWQAALRLALEA